MVKNRKLIEILAQFTYYEVENFKFDKDTAEFEYISIIKNIVCKCKYNKNYMNITITSDEWKRALPKSDIIIELSTIDKVRKYIHKLSKDTIIKIDESDNILIEVTPTEVSLIELDNDVIFLDKVLLNLFLLLDTKELLSLDGKTSDMCIYPEFDDRLLVNSPVMDEKYVDYMSYCYKDLEDGVTCYDNGFDLCYGNGIYVIRAAHLDYLIYDYPYISYILNKNFITAIKLLGQLHIHEDTRIKLCGNELVVYNPKNRIMYLNNNTLSDRKIVLGRIIGDKLIMDCLKDNGFKLSPILLIE